MAQSLPQIAQLIASFIIALKAFSSVKVYSLVTIVVTIGVLIMVTFQNLTMFLIGLFMAAGGTYCQTTLVCIISPEVMSRHLGQISLPIIWSGWSASLVLMGVMYDYYLDNHDWRNQNLYFIFIPSLLSCFCLLFLIESPKFTFLTNPKKALIDLNKIAKFNGKTALL